MRIAIGVCTLFAIMAILLFPTEGWAQTPPPPVEESSAETPAGGSADSRVGDVAEELAARTPVPTPTPGFVQREVGEFTQATGLETFSFLGLSAEDWINLGLSLLFFVVFYWLLLRLLVRVASRLVRRSQGQFDEKLLHSIEPEVKALVALVLLRWATLRLTFLSANVRILVDDTFFVLIVLTTARMAMKLINFGIDWYKTYLEPEDRKEALDPALGMIRNVGRLLVLIIAGSLVLDHFGLASNTLTVVVIVLGILVLLGIRDVLTDVIYGFIILVGQPFRKGDIVQVPGMSEDEWGWVTGIRSRATHICTVDNRTLVIPNRLLGVNEITNYSRPDPSYRMSTDLNLAYGSDFARVQQILTQATQAVDGVLADKGVDVFFEQFGPSTQVVRVRWWIGNCEQEHEMNSRVNAALEAALVAAALVPAYAALDVHIEREQSGTIDGVQGQT